MSDKIRLPSSDDLAAFERCMRSADLSPWLVLQGPDRKQLRQLVAAARLARELVTLVKQFIRISDPVWLPAVKDWHALKTSIEQLVAQVDVEEPQPGAA